MLIIVRNFLQIKYKFKTRIFNVLNTKLMLSKTLKRLRKEQNMTQKDLFSKSGVSNIQIGRYENGTAKPNKTTLTKLARAFDLSYEDLVSESNSGREYLDEKYNRLLNVISDKDYTFLEFMLDGLYKKSLELRNS